MSLTANIRCAVAGGSEDGKSFLVSGFVRGHWKRDRLRGLVFDPWKNKDRVPIDWGNNLGDGKPWVTDNFEKFRRAVVNTKNCCVVWDEATSNGGRDSDNVALLTEIRHLHPAFYMMVHSYAMMLPVMRGSLTHAVMAVRDPDDAKEWAKVMVDRDVLQSTTLKQYEFLKKRKHRPVEILRHTPAQIHSGIYL